MCILYENGSKIDSVFGVLTPELDKSRDLLISHQYIKRSIPTQRTEDFVYAIIQYFKHLDGVPRILVPDNLKAAVVKSDRYGPTINKVLDDMANHYGCVVIPASPLHPKDKANVENQVRIIYNLVYAELRNKKFYSLNELNSAVWEKMKAHNQKRMQQYTFNREERFLAIEKPHLLP